MIGRKKTGNSKLVKRMNKEEILSQLKEHGQISRADLAKQTELSRPCVSSLVEEMIQEGLIHEVGIGSSNGGRKPILLQLNYRAYAIAGAVFDGTQLHMALSDLRGEILARSETKLAQPPDTESVIRGLETGLASLVNKTGFARDRLLGIGVGLPGIAQRRSGTISFSPGTGWFGMPVQQEIEKRLGIPAIIDNDVNLMTYGEYARGVGIGAGTIVYMYVGTGIGSGIIIDGQMYRGCREAAGEIGFMVIGPAAIQREQEVGIFENHYSIPGIVRKAKGLLSGLQEGSSVIKQLHHHACQGNAEAQRLLDEIYQHWAYGMANVISILNPELLVLSGEMIHIDDKGVKTIHELLENWVPVMPKIKKAVLGDEAGMIGAVHSALEAFATPKLLER